MDVANRLNRVLLGQPFSGGGGDALIEQYQGIARLYSVIENSIAVLSDLRRRKSYIYHGGTSERLGLGKKNVPEEIDSIWEEKLFSRVHPDDLIRKHAYELRFFLFLKEKRAADRGNYMVSSILRMSDQTNIYLPVYHRMFYAAEGKNVELALCLYNLTAQEPLMKADGEIINTATGEVVFLRPDQKQQLLSGREVEVLSLIVKGKMSKDIAKQLGISLNTVNRHRQNILEKLRVKNSIEAYRIAEKMGLL